MVARAQGMAVRRRNMVGLRRSMVVDLRRLPTAIRLRRVRVMVMASRLQHLPTVDRPLTAVAATVCPVARGARAASMPECKGRFCSRNASAVMVDMCRPAVTCAPVAVSPTSTVNSPANSRRAGVTVVQDVLGQAVWCWLLL